MTFWRRRVWCAGISQRKGMVGLEKRRIGDIVGLLMPVYTSVKSLFGEIEERL